MNKENRPHSRSLRCAFIALQVLLLAACGGRGSDDPLEAIGADVTTNIGVNGYLWRASIETISALAITQADTGAGIILTDWFVSSEAPDERLKVAVIISDIALRADALRVTISREMLVQGIWQQAEVRAGTVMRIEDMILTRARELRIASLNDN